MDSKTNRQKGPLLNYDATLEEVYELLTIYPQVWIYDSATKKVINLSNLSKYFPDYDPGYDSGGSGGGSGGVTPEQLATALQGKVDKVTGKDLSTNDYTTEEKTKLSGLSNYDDTQVYQAINSLGRSIGSMGQAVEGKVDKVTGKGLSTEDYTTEEKTKLSGLSNYDDTALASRVSALETTVGDINSVLEEVL